MEVVLVVLCIIVITPFLVAGIITLFKVENSLDNIAYELNRLNDLTEQQIEERKQQSKTVKHGS